MKVIYATVVYDCPFFDLFLKEYINTIEKQDHNNFTLLIVNDDLSGFRLSAELSKYSFECDVEIVQTEGGFSPSKLRELLIRKACEMDGEVLIFSDFDETVTENRVSSVVNQIGDYEFAFNDFYLVDFKNRLLSENSCYSTRDIPKVLSNVQNLFHRNFCGLGSSTINLTKLDYSKFLVPDNVIAFDWFLFTWILLKGGKGIQIKNTFAYYRQYNNSLVGFDFRLDEKKLFQGLRVKKTHYEYFSQIHSSQQNQYRKYLNDIKSVEKYVADPKRRSNYITAVNTFFDTQKFTWWENIKLLEQLENKNAKFQELD
ncbi:MAG: hypothetical protein SRB1_02032 [Desulfobacteraceae bacterium Eth-SRB1]|nr:MAG: hypothetical protein SRB1_02032 [Desulfobacteraceae bacterium Eth-SRB1]